MIKSTLASTRSVRSPARTAISFASAALRSTDSSWSSIARITEYGSADVVGRYIPVLRICGSTSLVIQRWNSFASGLSERITSWYMADSSITVTCRFLPRESIVYVWRTPSGSSRSAVAAGFRESPNALERSLRTNHGSLWFMITRMR
ncbi:hypothetical protein HMPREF9336_04246 [Segniliparus rugosus ATCC BAA-974]|uniref:Uncharacterized protein n=1 Tax=Segniliparus rugosus (strain ATCC BAA-974 / DSM 45345 / CCUG 50838 / CIP 108380 / JCM 13579 / CDC 945) TaxID=679197 RepID=U1M120_SEGRC|nr:hypothetical protein [Segniliparus rugosus]ERG69102.1 hypothetical protein HMPREF9336_04246 [Segniliparus rugosus ATCC BAA-974]